MIWPYAACLNEALVPCRVFRVISFLRRAFSTLCSVEVCQTCNWGMEHVCTEYPSSDTSLHTRNSITTMHDEDTNTFKLGYHSAQ